MYVNNHICMSECAVCTVSMITCMVGMYVCTWMRPSQMVRASVQASTGRVDSEGQQMKQF
jgi:hypothetical protein